MLEGRTLLSAVRAAAVHEPAAYKPPTTQAQKFPAYNIKLFVTSPTDGSGSNQVFSPNVAVGGFAPPYSVVWLADGVPPAYFLQVTQANGAGDFAFPVQVGTGTTILQAFSEDSTQNYSTVAQVSVTYSNPIVAWDSLAVHAIEVQNLPAPEAARDLAVLHAAQYDAIADITDPSSAYQVHLTAPSGASAAAAANSAAVTVLTALFPSQASSFTSAEKTAIESLPKTPSVTQGQTFGVQVANQTLANRASDGSNAASGTSATSSSDLSTQYATVTPFVLSSGTVFRPAAPPSPGSSTFDQALSQVSALGRVNSTTRTADQTAAALFWNDGSSTTSVTDPLHWNLIAEQLAGARKDSLATDARLFAELDFALADAGIATSVSQASYKEARPATVLKQSDPTFLPLLVTPSSPSYVSDNAAYGASAAAVLTSAFGPNVKFTDYSEGNIGLTRSFSSINAAAAEDGNSRVWGGVNFSFDAQAGNTLGTQIGQAVVTTFKQK